MTVSVLSADARAHDKMHGNVIDFAGKEKNAEMKTCRGALHHRNTEKRLKLEVFVNNCDTISDFLVTLR